MKANDAASVIAGEAVSGTPEERWNDMLHIASVIVNRAAMLGVPVEDVISAVDQNGNKQFDAYGKQLPAGTADMVGMAQQALAEVQANGPVTPATFYATPEAVGGLPRGLDPATETTGHQYFTDPQNRNILTAQGYMTPNVELAPKASILDAGPGMVAGTPTSGGMGASMLGSLFKQSAMPTPSVDVGYSQANDLGLGPARMPAVSYKMGSLRPNMPDQAVVDNVQMAVESIMGPDARVGITSGKDDETQNGSNRHGTGLAVDIAVYDPQGNRLTVADNAQQLKDIGQAFSAITGGSVGLGYTEDGKMTNTFHLDQVKELSPRQDHSWGLIGNDPDYAAALADARQNKTMPGSYWDRVANHVTTAGIVPSLRDTPVPSIMSSYQPQQPEVNPFDALLQQPVTQADLAPPTAPVKATASMSPMDAQPGASAAVEQLANPVRTVSIPGVPNLSQFDDGRFGPAPTPSLTDPGRLASGYTPNFGPAMADLSSATAPQISASASMASMAGLPGASAIAAPMPTRTGLVGVDPVFSQNGWMNGTPTQLPAPINSTLSAPASLMAKTSSIADPATVSMLQQEVSKLASVEPGQLYDFKQDFPPSYDVTGSVAPMAVPGASTVANLENPGFWGDLAAADQRQANTAALSPASDAAARAAMASYTQPFTAPVGATAAAPTAMPGASAVVGPVAPQTNSLAAGISAQRDYVAPAAVPGAMLAPNFSQAYNSTVNGMVSPTTQDFSIPSTTPSAGLVDPQSATIPAKQYSVPGVNANVPGAMTRRSQTAQQPAEQGLITKALTTGPLGKLLGSIFGQSIMQNGLLGSMVSNTPESINSLGTGYAAMQGVYGPSAVRGNQFTASNGATVTALGDGRVSYVNKNGVAEVHDPNSAQGTVSAVW